MPFADSRVDIFISYSQRDRALAGELARFLTDRGYSVWWDYELVGGTRFRKEIMNKLVAARVCFVIWTGYSVESDWVVEEAEEAKHANKLIAVRAASLEFRSIPLGFRGIHTDVVTDRERIIKSLERMGLPPKNRPGGSHPSASIAGFDHEAIAKAQQFERWEAIKDSRDPDDYTAFLRAFPAGMHAGQARTALSKLANEAWRRVGGSQDIAALEEFVELFPDDVRAAEARRTIEAAQQRKEEANSWARVKDSGDIASVEGHLQRYPGGSTAAAARDLLIVLQRERHAAEHWRAIEESTDPEAFSQFLEDHPQSSFAQAARRRRDTLLQAREETEWKEVMDERHPAAVLRFLKRFPNGRHARDAVRLLSDMARMRDEEAWQEIKDSREPILFEAFLAGAALPNGPRAAEARARLEGQHSRAGEARGRLEGYHPHAFPQANHGNLSSKTEGDRRPLVFAMAGSLFGLLMIGWAGPTTFIGLIGCVLLIGGAVVAVQQLAAHARD